MHESVAADILEQRREQNFWVACGTEAVAVLCLHACWDNPFSLYNLILGPLALLFGCVSWFAAQEEQHYRTAILNDREMSKSRTKHRFAQSEDGDNVIKVDFGNAKSAKPFDAGQI